MPEQEHQRLRRLLASLDAELAERKATLPAHSLRPHQLREIEELEEAIRDLKEKITGLETGGT
jgi:hypothetical protein